MSLTTKVCILSFLCCTIVFMQCNFLSVKNDNFEGWKSYPTKRFGHSMVYDEENNRIILFGGTKMEGTSYISLSDTWVFECTTNTWYEQNHTLHPLARNNFGMVYDPTRQRILLFGGSYTDDTWIYDPQLNEWENIDPEITPRGRCSSSSIYDSFNREMVLFGGIFEIPITESAILNDTWVLNFENTKWEEILHPNPSTSMTFLSSNYLPTSLPSISASTIGFTI
ncbi:MAG: kelch repeat-containing protein [Promethearchaeota archaeon]